MKSPIVLSLCLVALCLAVAVAPPASASKKPESKSEKKGGANTSEAMKILEAANKDTTNTL